MPERARPYRLMVKLTAAERDALGARADAERVPMASVLRAAIEPMQPKVKRPVSLSANDDEPEPAPTRDRVLAQLADAADGGSVAAIVALERALRLGGPPLPPKSGEVTPAELRAALRAVR